MTKIEITAAAASRFLRKGRRNQYTFTAEGATAEGNTVTLTAPFTVTFEVKTAPEWRGGGYLIRQEGRKTWAHFGPEGEWVSGVC